MKHGRKATYDRHKCRCVECRAANAAYQRNRRRQQAGEQWKKEAA